MSSASVFSQCHGLLAAPNLPPITSRPSSSAHCASPVGSNNVSPTQFLREGYGLSKRSILRSGFGTSQIEPSSSSSSSSSSAGSSLIIRQSCDGRGSEARASENCGGKTDSVETSIIGSSGEQVRRRELVGAICSWIVLPGLIHGSSAFRAAAAEDAEDAEQSPESSSTIDAPPAKIGLIEKLLERSKANKAKHDEERLEAYYKRNFKDYFEFLKGSIINKDADNLTEAEKGILSWLEKNQ